MAKKVAYSSILIALAMIFSYLETLIPLLVGIPGIKIGLANLVVLLGFYYLPVSQILLITIIRIILTGFLFGGVSNIIYSLAGSILSFFVMLILYKTKKVSIIGVSIAGGVFHNIGQTFIAFLVTENLAIFYYFPILLISGLMAGTFVGIVGKKVKYYIA